MERRTFWLLSAAIVVLALVLREQYVLQANVLKPLGGDSGEYVRYAGNILQGYFGSGDAPDAFRPPGYPAFIALLDALGGQYRALVHVQAVLGSATVAATIALGRRWLPAWAALGAGFLLAVWPHHIAFTAEVLTEVLSCFLLVAALLASSVAKGRAWLLAGLLFAMLAMVNTVFAPLPVLAAAVLIGRSAPRHWLYLIGPIVILMGGWSMRPVDGGMDRVWMNLVQGSHPEYHRAYVEQRIDPQMRRMTLDIHHEVKRAVENPARGMSELAARLSESPATYAEWYASKPWLLWNWDIRIGAGGGPYVHIVENSTLDRPPLREVGILLLILNPLLFGLSVAAALCGSLWARGPGRLIALGFLLLTAVHVVLQAEPRYSIPYRPLQFLLVFWAIAWLWDWRKRLQARFSTPRDRTPTLGS